MDEKLYGLASWYYKKYGTLLIIAAPEKAQSKQLQEHLDQLREQYINGSLDANIKEKYDQIGMIWKDVEQHEWNYCYDLAKQYQQLFGTLDMPSAFEMNGVKLSSWIDEQKDAHKTGELSLSRERKMEKLGIQWSRGRDDRVSYSESALAYYVEKLYPDVIRSYKPASLKGKEIDIYIPSLKIGIEYDGGMYHKNVDKDLAKNKLCEENGIKLIRVRDRHAPKMEQSEGCIVINQSQTSSQGLNKVIRQVLTALGAKELPDVNSNRDRCNILNDMFEDKTYFNQYLMAAKHFYQDNGHLFVSKNYTDPTGIKLGQWIQNCRDSREFLSERQINSLDELDMVWEHVSKERWLYDFAKATSYNEIPEDEVTADGKSLKIWFEKQKEDYENFELYDDYKTEAMELYQKREQEASRSEHCSAPVHDGKKRLTTEKHISSNHDER